MAELVLEVLEDFNIYNRVGYFVMDNATNNDTMMDVIADTLNAEGGIYYDPRQRRLRCNGHIINLAVQAFLFGKNVNDYELPEGVAASASDQQIKQWRKLGPLGKLHNSNFHIMASAQRIQRFKKLSDGLMPHRDNGII